MESQPQNPEFKNKSEKNNPWINNLLYSDQLIAANCFVHPQGLW